MEAGVAYLEAVIALVRGEELQILGIVEEKPVLATLFGGMNHERKSG